MVRGTAPGYEPDRQYNGVGAAKGVFFRDIDGRTGDGRGGLFPGLQAKPAAPPAGSDPHTNVPIGLGRRRGARPPAIDCRPSPSPPPGKDDRRVDPNDAAAALSVRDVRSGS